MRVLGFNPPSEMTCLIEHLKKHSGILSLVEKDDISEVCYTKGKVRFAYIEGVGLEGEMSIITDERISLDFASQIMNQRKQEGV